MRQGKLSKEFDRLSNIENLETYREIIELK